MPEAPKVKVASTGSSPERPDRLAIARSTSPGAKRAIVLSLGPGSDTELPLPDIKPGDRLRIFAELEVTTNPDRSAPGLVGSAYTYTPKIEATLWAARDAEFATAKAGYASQIGPAWSGSCAPAKHHEVITFGDWGLEIDEPDWPAPYYLNLAVGVCHPSAKSGDRLLIGQNEKEGGVGIDMAGIRVVRLRPGAQPAVAAQYTRRPFVWGIPVNPAAREPKQWVAVYSHPLTGLKKGDQLLVRARMNTNASSLGYETRLSSRLFVSDDARAVEPGEGIKRFVSWNGHLSKPNGVNRLPSEGTKLTQKFGVAEILRAPGQTLYATLSAIAAAPYGGVESGDKLALGAGGSVEVTRYPASMNG
jgi:hypothetical protein